MSRRYRRLAALFDAHSPFEDRAAIDPALAFVREYKPEILVLGGDWGDFYAVSTYSREPLRRLQLQEELDHEAGLLEEVREAAPKSEIIYLQGNHEWRLRRHLWSGAPELARLRSLQIEALLNLAKLRITYVEAGSRRFGDLLIKHGNIVRPRSGYSAMGELDRTWVSGASGHTHRLGHVFRTNAAGMFSWIEGGCLCRSDMDYLEGQTADWQHGVVWAEVSEDRFVAGVLPIISGKVNWGGREIGGKG
jgi:hypothetical protein